MNRRIVGSKCFAGTALSVALISAAQASTPVADEVWEGYWNHSARQKAAVWRTHLLQYAMANAYTLSLDQLEVVFESPLSVDPAWFVQNRPGKVPAEVADAVQAFSDRLLSVLDESDVESLVTIPEAYRAHANHGPGGVALGCPPVPDCNCGPPQQIGNDCPCPDISYCRKNTIGLPCPNVCNPTSTGCGQFGLWPCEGRCFFGGICDPGDPG